MTQIQVRMPEENVSVIDKWVNDGRFRSRSDAIKVIVSYYQERENTMKFLNMLNKRSEEAKDKKILVRLEEI